MYEQSTYNFKLNCKVKEKQQYHQSKKKKKEKNKSLKSGEAQTDTKNHSFILQISLCPFLNSTNPDPFFYVKKKKGQSYITKSTVPSLRITSHCLSSFLYRKYISSSVVHKPLHILVLTYPSFLFFSLIYSFSTKTFTTFMLFWKRIPLWMMRHLPSNNTQGLSVLVRNAHYYYHWRIHHHPLSFFFLSFFNFLQGFGFATHLYLNKYNIYNIINPSS